MMRRLQPFRRSGTSMNMYKSIFASPYIEHPHCHLLDLDMCLRHQEVCAHDFKFVSLRPAHFEVRVGKDETGVVE